MNNDFNNQNMNQFQNSNMNSQYLNNYNNLSNQNNNKGNNGLIVVLVIIIITLIGLCLFFALDNKDTDADTNKDNNIQENENNKENINLSDSKIKEYLKYVPYLDATLIDGAYDDAYSNISTNVNIINKNILLYSAIANVEKYDFKQGDNIPKLENGFDAISYYNVNDVVNLLNDVYNIDNSNMPSEIKIPGGKVILKDKYYLPIMGAGSIAYDKYVYSTNYYLENNNLIIEENVLFYIYNIGDSKCNVYANTSDMHNETNVIDTFDLDYTLANNISLKDYTDKTPTKYKHTYKKVNNEYVWYSTEKIK